MHPASQQAQLLRDRTLTLLQIDTAYQCVCVAVFAVTLQDAVVKGSLTTKA